MPDAIADAEVEAFHLRLDGLSSPSRARALALLEQLEEPTRRELDAANAAHHKAHRELETAESVLAAAQAAMERASAVQATRQTEATAANQAARKHVLSSLNGDTSTTTLEEEVLTQLVQSQPALHALLGASPSDSRLTEELRAHAGGVLKSLDGVLRRRRAIASRHPPSSKVESDHHEALARSAREGRPLRIPADRHPRARAPAAAYLTLAQEGRLHAVRLADMRTRALPLSGGVMSGVLVAPVYPFEMAQADGASSSGVCALLQADGGGSCRVRVHACPPDEAAQLRAGRRVCILHVWLTMGGDGWPCIRVDDAATLHYDKTPEALIRAIGQLVASHADPDGGVVRRATEAKEAGSAAFRSGRFAEAHEMYTRGISVLLLAGDVPIASDLGLAAHTGGTDADDGAGSLREAPILLRSSDPAAVALAVSLLTNRSATALKLRRPFRALCDADAAASLAPSAKVAFRRAQALLSIGHSHLAISTLRPYSENDTELRRLSVQAEAHRDGTIARVRGAATDAPTTDGAPPRYIASMVLARLPPSAPSASRGEDDDDEAMEGGGEAPTASGVGWAAVESIGEGALVMCEPAAALAEAAAGGSSSSTAIAMRVARGELSPLAAAVGGLLSRGGAVADELRDLLCALQPEAEDAAEAEGLVGADDGAGAAEIGWLEEAALVHSRLRHQSGAPFANLSNLDVATASRVQAAVRALGQQVSSRADGESVQCGVGLFPLSALCTHSCRPNAAVMGYDAITRTLIIRAVRRIAPGEHVSVACIDLSSGFIGHHRRRFLHSARGAPCRCEVCNAPVGSILHQRECLELSLVNPRTDKRSVDEVIVPADPYAPPERLRYTCVSDGSDGGMDAATAAEAVKAARASFEALRSPFELGSFQPGCHAARVAERQARTLLGPCHHLWGLWVEAATALAGGANDTELLCMAYKKREAMETEMHRMGESDIRLLMQYAVAQGLGSSEATAAFQAAFELDRIACGEDADVFAARWAPPMAKRVRAAAAAAARASPEEDDDGGADPPPASLSHPTSPNGHSAAEALLAEAKAAEAKAAEAAAAAERLRAAAAAAAATAAQAEPPPVKAAVTPVNPAVSQAGTPRMHALADALSATEASMACALAEQRIKQWVRTRYADGVPSADEHEAFAYAGFDSAPTAPSRELLTDVWMVEHVLSPSECDTVLAAVEAAASRRGGWDRDRHGTYPTTDMPLRDVPEAEALVRSAVFRNVIRPLARHYLPAHFLPELLEWQDAFFVKYDATPGAQRDLNMHTDGSIFSFNLLLNDPSDFQGGGTLFEPTGMVVRPPRRGTAIGHSGQVRHAGVAITSGRRYLLVGFIGCAKHAFATRGAGWQAAAAREAFLKFGKGAWERGAYVEPTLVRAEEPPGGVPPVRPPHVEQKAPAAPIEYVPVD